MLHIIVTCSPHNCHVSIDADCNPGQTLYAHGLRVNVYMPFIRRLVAFPNKWRKVIAPPRPTTPVDFAHACVRVGTCEREERGGQRVHGDICGKPHILPVNRQPSALHTDFRRRRKLWNAPSGFSGSRGSSTLIILSLITLRAFRLLLFSSSSLSEKPLTLCKGMTLSARWLNGLACWKPQRSYCLVLFAIL